MTRIKLFEFEDLSWFPNSIRDAGTDILRFMWEKGSVYKYDSTNSKEST